MSQIFISYSRKDLAIAERIVDALAKHDLKPWIDWKSIPKGEEFESEIYRGVEGSNVFLFLVSPSSVKSEWCNREIEHAARNGKRILPIIIRDTKPEFIHPEIAKHNWISCKDKQLEFDNAIEEINKTILTDFEWVKYHTKLQVKAIDWENGKDTSRLLRGKELQEAEQELSKISVQADPQPTSLQREYILVSRKSEERQRRQIIVVLSLGLMVLAFLSVFAWVQRNSAIAERDNANHQARISRSGQLAALSQALNNDYPERSLLLAIEAIKVTSDAGEKRIPEAEQALRDGLHHLSGIGISGPETAILATTFSPDNRWLATGSLDGSIHIYDVNNQDSINQSIVFHGHHDGITALAFSPDGHWLASGGGSDAADLFQESGSINSAMLTMAMAKRRGDEITVQLPDTQIRIWNLDDPDPKQNPILLSGHTEQVTALAFSPDGRWFASSSLDDTIQLWDRKKDSNFATKPIVLRGHTLNIVTIAFSQDGHWLVSASLDQTARLWDLTVPDPNTHIIELVGHSKAIQAIALSSDSRWLATSGIDFSVRLWDLKSNDPSNQAIVLEGHKKNVMELAFSPDGHWLASGSVDSTIRLWDLSKPETINNSQVLQGPENYNFSSMVFTPNSRWLITGGGFMEGQSNYSNIYLWDMASELSKVKPKIFAAHDDFTQQITISPDGHWLASASLNGSSRLWNMNSLENYSPDTPVTSSPVTFLPISGDIKINVVSSNGLWLAKVAGFPNDSLESHDIYLWQLDKIGTPVQTKNLAQPIKLSGHTESIISVTFSPNNQWLASGGTDRTVRLWNLASSNFPNQSVVLEHTGIPTGISFSPDNHWLATANYGKEIYIWDLTRSDPSSSKITLGGTDEDISPGTVVFSPDGQWIAAGTYTGPVHIWSIPASDQAKPYLKMTGHVDEITKIIFLGEKLITSSADTTARIWIIDKENLTADSIILHGHTGPILTMNISNDNRWLATGSTDFTTRLWDLSSQSIETNSLVLSGHNNVVFDTAFSHNNQLLATGSLDGTVKLWDLTSPDPTRTVINLPGTTSIFSIAITPDDNWIITSTSAGEVYTTLGNIRNLVTTTKLWNLNLESLVILACRVSGRNLTYAEWQEYFPGEDYRLTCQSNPIHPSILTAAHQLVMRGEIENARLLLNQAKVLDPNLDIDIEAEILQYRVYGLLREARDMAQTGDIQGANAKIEEAAKLDHSLEVASGNEIDQIAGAAIDKQIEIYITQNNYLDAIKYLSSIEQIQSDSLNLPSLWNNICWEGGLNHHAEDVLTACEQAVTLDPFNPNYRDSRGLVRALTGDRVGAIEDFSYFVEWIYGSDSLARKNWISDLQAGTNPFGEKTLSELKDGTYALPPLPDTVQSIETKEKWKIDVVNMPDDLKVEFPAFLQCRVNKDSDQMVEELVGILAVKPLRENAWVNTGVARIVLESVSGEEIGEYYSYFQFGPNEIGWLIPKPNTEGKTMPSSGSAVDRIKIEFLFVDWRPVTADNSQYQFDAEIESQSHYGNNKYPQSQFSLKLNNTGPKTIEGLTLFGVLLDQNDKLVDILVMDPNAYSDLAASNTSVNYVMSSFSQTGRCVGPKPSNTTFHYWITFESDTGQRITRHYYEKFP